MLICGESVAMANNDRNPATMTIQRRTINAPTPWLRGIGLFTGAACAVRFTPGDANTPDASDASAPGAMIVFQRVDHPGSAPIEATVGSLSDAPVHPAFASMPARCTTLASPDEPRITVALTEHALAAAYGLGLTDLIIEAEGPEIPILDGSSLPFALALRAAGVRELGLPVEPIRLSRPVRVDAGGASVTAEPLASEDAHAEWRYDLAYPGHALLGSMRADWHAANDFCETVAMARTFALEAEARAMREAGLFAHVDPSDALVIGERGPLAGGLRTPDEPARHKLLDMVGDLALLGRPLLARVHADRSGHALNHALARKILDEIA